MSELRQNLVNKEWVIIATERAKRPEDFIKPVKLDEPVKPEYSPKCPFCPGNESQTPPAILQINDDRGDWLTRLVPNRFAALSPDCDPTRTINGLQRGIQGCGYHDVLVESRLHNTTTALQPVNQIQRILELYRERYLQLQKDPRVAAVIIFKNHGEAAGTSLEHPHSQIVATPVIPQSMRNRIEESTRYYDDEGQCVVCKVMNEEIREGRRMVAETEHFAAFVPFAAETPFHTWIVPKTHRSHYLLMSDEELHDLAGILKTVLGKLYYGLNNPDFNYLLRVAPWDDMDSRGLHWYITVILRLNKVAGFELGSGIVINTSLPEDNARFLREVQLPND